MQLVFIPENKPPLQPKPQQKSPFDPQPGALEQLQQQRKQQIELDTDKDEV
ncbi:hypothetical protein D3C75_1196680 [compost metagenome]